MKFVDEAVITIHAGKGGPGCLSFRREKNIARGGPDGGDGGRGGSVYLVTDSALNTLADFRYTRIFKAKNGAPGEGRNKSGRGGDDQEIAVPVGTVVCDADTGELISDLDREMRFVVARGGDGGFGNARYKSSTNRTPRKSTPGYPGDVRRLSFELKLLADVGLVGMPNAGKSTLLSAVSQARPRVADYPFTTLHPELGVISIEAGRSFVMADIPGLIQGAAEGAGLGIQFLRHVTRTRLLLHLVDMVPMDPARSPARDIREIEAELEAFDSDLITRERWLVMNKLDLMSKKDADRAASELIDELAWDGPHYKISAASGIGCREMMGDAMTWIERVARDAQEADNA